MYSFWFTFVYILAVDSLAVFRLKLRTVTGRITTLFIEVFGIGSKLFLQNAKKCDIIFSKG